MKFRDASAVVPLVVAEEETDHCRRLLAEDVQVVVWFLSVIEIISALTRLSGGIARLHLQTFVRQRNSSSSYLLTLRSGLFLFDEIVD